MVQGDRGGVVSAWEQWDVLNAAIVSSMESNLAAALGISVEGIVCGVVCVCSQLSCRPASPNVPRVAAKVWYAEERGVS